MIQIHENNEFKRCSGCNLSWASREDFLADSSLELVGYQVHFRDLEQGLFLFNHFSCKSTISVKSGNFANLYKGPIYSTNKLGTESCPDHCLAKDNLQSCPEQCECTYVRDVMQIIKAWDKKDK
jgi:hypothetical protein